MAVVIVVMGVAGAGKTTVGRQLARQLGWPFYDADDLHAPTSIERMRRGAPLTNEHRTPWLTGLAELIGEHTRARRSMILACSALRRSHRAALLANAHDHADVRMVHLRADPAVLADRLAGRVGHFFPPNLLASQLAALEAPDEDEGVLVLDCDQPADELVREIRSRFDI
jgi:gluconokinase